MSSGAAPRPLDPHRASGAGGPHLASGAGGPHLASGAGGPHLASGAGGPHLASGAGGPHLASGAGGLDLVAVGCSWGGLAAAGHLLECLPETFDVATVIVQHRSEAPSALAELLGRHTPRPVREPDDKEPVAPGTVYVAPPGYHLLVDRQRFSLDTEAPVRFSRPSVDVLFESAAGAYGPRLAAVVLTGANDDGAAGLARVAAAGGLALVQDPATADRPAMPLAALAAVPAAVVGDIPALARTLVAAAAPEGISR